MSKKDDNHMKQIMQSKWLSSSSSDALNKYKTKITKLANSLRRDVLDHDVRALFTNDEIKSIEQAVMALTGFKKTVAAAQEHKLNKEKHHQQLQQKLFTMAKSRVIEKYSYAPDEITNKVCFILAEADACRVGGYLETIDEIDWRTREDSPVSPKTFPYWVDTKYHDALNNMANLILGYLDEELKEERVERYFKKLDQSMKLIGEKEQKRLDDVAWFYAKHSSDELSEDDRKSLGL